MASEAVGSGSIPLGTTREIPSTVLENVVSPNDQRSTLAQHAQRLRERTDAICRFSGGLPSFEEGLQVFRDYCDDVGFRVDPPVDLSKEPDARGDEHEVWFVGKRVIKLAHPDFFGLRVVHRSDEDQRCLPCEYFERWVLHNEIFGDDVDLPGAVDSLEGARMVLTQQAIKGTPADVGKIEEFFLGNGWCRFQANGNTAWLDETRSLVVSDTHQGNLIQTGDGILVPIDFRIQPVSGAMLDAVRSSARSLANDPLRHRPNKV